MYFLYEESSLFNDRVFEFWICWPVNHFCINQYFKQYMPFVYIWISVIASNSLCFLMSQNGYHSYVSEWLSVIIKALATYHPGLTRLMESCTEFTHHCMKLSHEIVAWSVLLKVSLKIKGGGEDQHQCFLYCVW